MNLAKYATIAGNLCRSGLFLGEGMLKIASLKDQVRYQMLTGCVLKKHFGPIKLHPRQYVASRTSFVLSVSFF